MKYFIITYGCQMNESDSERIASMLENTGYKPAPTMNELKEDKSSSRPLAKAQGADLIVVNMCSVRQSAVDRIYGLLSKFKKSIQNAVVKDVRAESALEYAAAIIPSIKTTEVKSPK